MLLNYVLWGREAEYIFQSTEAGDSTRGERKKKKILCEFLLHSIAVKMCPRVCVCVWELVLCCFEWFKTHSYGW